MYILSAIQFSPRLASCSADVADNIRKCSDLLSSAEQIGSDLIVLPELAFTGYSFMNMEEAIVVSEQWNGPTFRAMREFAMSSGSHVAWGYVESDPDTELLYNSATIVAPNGNAIARTRKLNLWGNDFLWASPGSEMPPVVQTELGLMSVIICRDIRNVKPTLLRTSSLYDGLKPDIVAACTNWGEGGFPSSTWMEFAATNSCVMVIANRWGEETNNDFTQDFGRGGSVIIGKDWKVKTSGLKFNTNCVVSALMEP